jgi:hypothetical protein
MKKFLIATLALTAAAVAATPTYAVTKKQRMYLSEQGRAAYAQYQRNGYGVVFYDNKVIGADPDLNIRALILRDPIPNEY